MLFMEESSIIMVRNLGKAFAPTSTFGGEYYRKSPVFDQKFYFDFYYSRLNELDQLPLLKRIKILVRYFVYGRRKNP